ncbi:MAG TPA: hypothetical protein VIH57_10935 [Bacteroidales bacterium]
MHKNREDTVHPIRLFHNLGDENQLTTITLHATLTVMKKARTDQSTNNRTRNRYKWDVGEVRIYRLKQDIAKILRVYGVSNMAKELSNDSSC